MLIKPNHKQMKNIKLLITSVVFIALFGSCNFIENVTAYKSTTKDFVEALLNQNYDKGISLMSTKFTEGRNKDTLKATLGNIRHAIIENFGDKLNYSFESATKTFSTDNSETTPPGETLVFIQISNAEVFGEVKVIFDDQSKKILSFYLLNEKEPLPKMGYFWLFGILTLGVLAFNIYMIVKVKRSNLKTKWPKYLAIILLNVPTIGYKALGGAFFSLINFQFLLGVSFNFTGSLNWMFAFGVPVGSLFVLYRLSMGLYKTKDEITTDDYVEPELPTE